MRTARALGLYALLTVLLTWPLPLRLRVMDAGDSAFFAWVMAWEMHALGTDPARLPHANIYHPARYTLGMDEPVLGTMVLGLPLRVFTADAVLIMNLVRLLTFALSGLSAYLLARSLGCGEGPALFAGAAFAFSPIRTDQMAHLSTLGTQWLPLVLLFLFRFFRTNAWRDALLCAVFYALASYACGYHGIMGVALLPLASVPLVWGRLDRLPRAAIALAVVALALTPLLWLHRQAMEPHGFGRRPEEVRVFSASLESFLATSAANRVYGELSAPFRTLSNNLFPGLVVPAVVVAGAIGLRRRRQRPDRELLALGILAVSAALLALGPEVRLCDRTLLPGPFALVRAILPVFDKLRVPSRAGMFMALALAILAGRALRRWQGRPALLAGVTALALAETAIVPVEMPAWMQVVDTRRPPPPVYDWLRAQPGETAVVELPILEKDLFRRPAFDESIYMVHSTRHWKRLVNGYAGVEPAHYREARELARRFPSQAAIEHFRRLGVRYVILHRGGYGPNQWARIERDLPAFATALHEVARFDGDTVFELAAPAQTAPTLHAPTLH